jgi:MOSC domain-containing protein YiiM
VQRKEVSVLKLISINVGLPRAVNWRGKTVTTSIWKSPVQGPVSVSKLNLAGDQQSDLSVHGGIDKAIYAYPLEHYSYWRSRLTDADLVWGAFGENFTVEGMLEDQVQVGAIVRAGSAEFVVTQPRLPCFKLGIRFDRLDMVKLFLQSRRTGFYLKVLREGEVTAGDAIDYANGQVNSLTVADIVDLYISDSANQDLLRRASSLAGLPDGWKDYFRKRLWDPDA